MYSASELLLSILAKEHERESFTFIPSEAKGNPDFLSALKSLVRDGLIEMMKPNEVGIVYFQVSEDGHQKVAELDEALWSECLPFFEEARKKYNQ